MEKNKLEINNTNCVNSKHKARFLAKDNEEYCQCSFGECKVRVLIAYNGNKPYEFILTENEIHEAHEVLYGGL